jgi:hypothetical protein
MKALILARTNGTMLTSVGKYIQADFLVANRDILFFVLDWIGEAVTIEILIMV